MPVEVEIESVVCPDTNKRSTFNKSITLSLTNITRSIITQDMTSKMEVDPVTVPPEVDELEDEFDSEDEDPNPDGFRIHEPLQPPQATLFTTQVLHSMLGL